MAWRSKQLVEDNKFCTLPVRIQDVVYVTLLHKVCLMLREHHDVDLLTVKVATAQL